MDRLMLLLSCMTLGAPVLHAAPPPPPAERALTIEGPVRLPAQLSLPKGPGPFPAVVLVHGSGPADKDQGIGEFRPFRDLAQGLSQRGVAVLRYDKRTHVSPSAAVATVADEVTDDARAALKLLAAQPDIDKRRVFLLGYDLGAYLAPRIAADAPTLAGAVLLGGAARPLWDLHVDQVEKQLRAAGALDAEGRRQLKQEQDAARRMARGPLHPQDQVPLLGRLTPATYWLDLRPYDAVRAARGLRQPLLLLFGEQDSLVSARDRELWQKGLRGRAGTTFKSYPTLSHLFRVATVQGEIADIDQPGPIAEQVVADIADWLGKQGR